MSFPNPNFAENNYILHAERLALIQHSTYKNKKSLVLESGKVRAEFTANPGGKMVSLVNKETGYEFMVQRSGRDYNDQPFGGVYTEGECSGFDEMFPTIDECYYENEPWKGVKMVDHGEVWSLPWSYRINDKKLNMSARGVNFPYRLEKDIFLKSEDTIRIEYTLTNNSEHDLEFLWAGHMMINIKEGTKVVVPGDCKENTTILTNGNRKYGDINKWPYLKDKEGNNYRADISRSKDTKGFEKYYFNNKLKKGWCELHYPDQKNILKVSFSEKTVPYLGILMNENGWDGLYNVIIEPCTICFDRPDVAKKYGQQSILKASGTYQWFIEIKI